MPGNETRERIIEEADRLFYERGFEHASFAQIAEAVNISRGNFYHHFKSKDDILQAVIEHRLHRTRQMLAQWQAQGSTPEERIRCFIQILIMNRAKIKRYGCPVGSLCSELARLNHPSQGGALKLFGLFRRWLRQQFEALGCAGDADELAMHLLARSQGIATLASAYRDESFIRREVEQLNHWLTAQLAAKPNR